MDKYGFRVKKPEKYDYGERITLLKNNMVVDIYKHNKDGIYYRFKTNKAENIYRKNNAKIEGNYNYLPSQEEKNTHNENNDYKKIGWVVPNEDYEIKKDNNEIIETHLDKSHFSI